MSDSNNSGSNIFGEIKNVDLEFPKVNANKLQQQESGREVNVNLKSSNSKTPTTKVSFNGNNHNNDKSTVRNRCNNRKRINLQLSVTPKKNLKNNQYDLVTNENIYSNYKSKKNDIALNVNLAFNVDDDKKNMSNISYGSDNLDIANSKQTMETPSAIKVAVRMRPLLPGEIKNRKDSKITDVLIKKNEVLIPQRQDLFEFDYCLDSTDTEAFNYASQEVVYRTMGQPLLDYALQGYNVCLFAYGQSGSGKTYTMIGADDNPGITPRFINDLFRRIDFSQNIEFIVNISFLEIYNEKIYDLLSNEFEMATKNLRVREHPDSGPYVEDLTVYTVENYENAMELLKTGLNRRLTTVTTSNDKSSRSHSIFSIVLVQNKKFNNEDSITETSCISKINLVDLAGSERVETSNTNRFREGTMINKSLLTLGKVITQLAEKSNSQQNNYVPYRDSLLTYILKESLGGNSRTSMIATISPAKTHLDETLSTLRYASTAQKIINLVHINEDPKVKIINGLLKQISFLKKEVNKNKNDSNLNLENPDDCQEKNKISYENIIKFCSELKEKFQNIIEQQKEFLNKTKNLKEESLKNFEKKSDVNIEKFEHKFLDSLKSAVHVLKENNFKNNLVESLEILEKKENEEKNRKVSTTVLQEEKIENNSENNENENLTVESFEQKNDDVEDSNNIETNGDEKLKQDEELNEETNIINNENSFDKLFANEDKQFNNGNDNDNGKKSKIKNSKKKQKKQKNKNKNDI